MSNTDAHRALSRDRPQKRFDLDADERCCTRAVHAGELPLDHGLLFIGTRHDNDIARGSEARGLANILTDALRANGASNIQSS